MAVNRIRYHWPGWASAVAEQIDTAAAHEVAVRVLVSFWKSDAIRRRSSEASAGAMVNWLAVVALAGTVSVASASPERPAAAVALITVRLQVPLSGCTSHQM